VRPVAIRQHLALVHGAGDLPGVDQPGWAAVTTSATGWPGADIPAPADVRGGNPLVWTVPAGDVRQMPRLADRVADLLDQLGATAEQVARTLAAAYPPVRGWPGDPDMDPVCRWLTAADPRLQVWLRDRTAHAEGMVGFDHEIALVPLPAPVLAFRAACTAGGYPEMWLPARAGAIDIAREAGPAGCGAVAGPAPVPPAGMRNPPAVPAPAAAAAPDRAPASARGGGRGLAHLPYGDAVVQALDLRGIIVAGYWPSPAGDDGGRALTVELDPDVCVHSWPTHTKVVLRWSERGGWRLLPMRGRQVDLQDALAWWDARRPGQVSPALPYPDRLAWWVADVAAGRVPDATHGTIRLAELGQAPSWRPAWPRGDDPDFETALGAYRMHAGHRIADQQRRRQREV
jgi:hypothetical protein